MKNIIQYSLAVATLLVLNTSPARAAGSVKTTSDVIEISTGNVVGSSTLRRTSQGISMTIHTTGIPAGHAITVWFCVRTFLTAGSFDCVRASGHIVGADGKVNAAGAVKVGDASESISPALGTDGLGLLDPFGDFVVLVVRDHGPATGIRESDAGAGPTGTGDGNAMTVGDPTWSPLGAPASNLQGPNFTPPFPAYPSGHAGFGGALFQTLRNFYGTDNIAFTFVSDEFNGVTRANDGSVRPIIRRSFSSLSQAEEENGQSRIYLGIHWSFDKTEGIAQGRHVANYVFENTFTPVSPGRR